MHGAASAHPASFPGLGMTTALPLHTKRPAPLAMEESDNTKFRRVHSLGGWG